MTPPPADSKNQNRWCYSWRQLRAIGISAHAVRGSDLKFSGQRNHDCYDNSTSLIITNIGVEGEGVRQASSLPLTATQSYDEGRGIPNYPSNYRVPHIVWPPVRQPAAPCSHNGTTAHRLSRTITPLGPLDLQRVKQADLQIRYQRTSKSAR
jgi:hypothetical protein